MSSTHEGRNEKKKRKPDFIRQDAHKHKGGRMRWRKPRGLQSKVRLEKRGYKKKVKTGYRGPVATRGMNASGKKIHYISSQKELETIKKEEAVCIKKVGMKTKKAIIEEAKKKGITLLNADQSILEKIEQMLKERKQRKQKREAAKKEKETKKEKKKDSETEEAEEEQKQKEKKEKDKILTKRV